MDPNHVITHVASHPCQVSMRGYFLMSSRDPYQEAPLAKSRPGKLMAVSHGVVLHIPDGGCTKVPSRPSGSVAKSVYN